MKTDVDRNAELKNQALYAVLHNVGNLISIYLSDADFGKVRELKANIDNLFIAADKAVRESKVKAASCVN